MLSRCRVPPRLLTRPLLGAESPRSLRPTFTCQTHPARAHPGPVGFETQILRKILLHVLAAPKKGVAFEQAFLFFCEVSRAHKGRRAIIVPVRVLVEFRPAGASWETLGTFTAAPDELAALRSVLERHDNPYDALSLLPKGLLFDTLDILRSAGHEARLAFLEDH